MYWKSFKNRLMKGLLKVSLMGLLDASIKNPQIYH